MSRPPPVFVVGTGRCGSTLVSTLMREHPEVLSISELFSFVTDLGSLIPRAFPTEPLSGREFWSVMADPSPRLNQLLRAGLRMGEIVYPFGRGRYRADGGVPTVSMTMLPHIDDDPDGLFDVLAAAMQARGVASAAEHYRGMFELLMRRYDRRTWVERSGGSLRIIRRLVDAFPDARFVHLVRDGRNTAISMSQHVGFRMALIGYALLEFLGVDPWESDDRSEIDDLTDDLAALLPENFTAEAFADYDISPSLCGHYWSGEIKRGLAVLREVPAERRMTLRYEDLLLRPRASLERLDAALGLGPVDRAWIDKSLRRIDRGRSSWQALAKAEQRELQDACAPGFAALAAEGIRWPDLCGH